MVSESLLPHRIRNNGYQILHWILIIDTEKLFKLQRMSCVEKSQTNTYLLQNYLAIGLLQIVVLQNLGSELQPTFLYES